MKSIRYTHIKAAMNAGDFTYKRVGYSARMRIKERLSTPLNNIARELRHAIRMSVK